MQVWSISSGSAGNCYLVRDGNSFLILEAGIAVASVERELARLGASPGSVVAILASHEHVDHWVSATTLARRWKAPLVCSPGTFDAGGAARSATLEHLPLRAGGSARVGNFTVEAFALPHDAREPIGFTVRSGPTSVCLATDMGMTTDELVERARLAELVILEANHDLEMLRRGPYPARLKARILGERGHISNEEAGQALVRIAEGRPRQFWLAHLSDTNNTPGLALSSVRGVLRRCGLDRLELSVALRGRRSVFWDSDPTPDIPRQLPLF